MPCLGGSAVAATQLGGASAIEAAEGTPDRDAIERLGFPTTPYQRFAIGSGDFMRVASFAYDREEVSPLVDVLDSLPHGPELAKLKLYVATDAEVGTTCGAGTMACYDPVSERMIVSGQSEEVAGIPREAVIAHEYGHHIANNRAGGIWSALSAGTPRWSTYERVCELAQGGQAFPGDEGTHYWENPGEAFAQSYSQMVLPQTDWFYSPLLRPDEAALTQLRLDVLRPWRGPHTSLWRHGAPEQRGRGVALGGGVAVGGNAAQASPVSRRVAVHVDGRLRVRLKAADGSRYALALVDPATGATVARAVPLAHRRNVTSLTYSDCGQRSLVVEAASLGAPGAFEAKIVTP